MLSWLERNVRIVAVVLGALLALVIVFCAGVAVGARGFSLSPRGPLFLQRPFGSPSGFATRLPGHGAVGMITAIEGNTITMTDRLGEVQKIAVVGTTQIERERGQKLKLQDLQQGDRIVVIGSPENGVMRARFIRVLAPLPVQPKQ